MATNQLPKVNHKGKYVMNTFWHPKINACYCRITLCQTCKHTIILIFPPIKGTSFVKIVFWKEWQIFDTCKHKGFIYKISTNCMGRWFLTINKPISSRNKFCCICFFWKGFLVEMFLTITLQDGFWFFWQVVYPLLLSTDYSLPPQTFLQ